VGLKNLPGLISTKSTGPGTVACNSFAVPDAVHAAEARSSTFGSGGKFGSMSWFSRVLKFFETLLGTGLAGDLGRLDDETDPPGGPVRHRLAVARQSPSVRGGETRGPGRGPFHGGIAMVLRTNSDKITYRTYTITIRSSPLEVGVSLQVHKKKIHYYHVSITTGWC